MSIEHAVTDAGSVHPSLRMSDAILLSLGSNQPGAWGDPAQTLETALRRLAADAIEVVAVGAVFKTPAVGPHQPAYLNVAVAIRANLGPAALLRVLKQLERAAGRRQRGRWTARPLDIDIVNFKGARLSWPSRRNGCVTLPHSEAHKRAFVLVTTLAVAPHWVHPALAMPARRLLKCLPPQATLGIKKLTACSG